MSDKPTTGGDDIIALTERIATLELELDAYAAHASGLQARLLSTLDALQQARLEHVEELGGELDTRRPSAADDKGQQTPPLRICGGR